MDFLGLWGFFGDFEVLGVGFLGGRCGLCGELVVLGVWGFESFVRLGVYWGIECFGGTFAVIGRVVGIGFWVLWRAIGVRGTTHVSSFSSL